MKDSASALSALKPIALMDWRTPALRQASAHARLVYWAPVAGVHDRPVKAAARSFGGGQGADDGAGPLYVLHGRPQPFVGWVWWVWWVCRTIG
ncbi:hypothetical protein LG634_19265 [Streptomyces bambusae]|uniref:hypothetical protein n=1 Tax=Streptomyces bambusae TaxID=1550616 RepID=UPI001CFD49FA|nr:hypothetical protein [Streptomyces bambusae]MCB5166971.1 hypothetical protein [Streptomyces bambusae]